MNITAEEKLMYDVMKAIYESGLPIIFKGSTEILETIKFSDRLLDSFNAFLNKVEDLQLSYNKFRFTGNVNKPTFDEIYHNVKTYINDILPKLN